jgi:phosphate-selective porin O/P
MKSLLLPCLVLAALTAVRVSAADPKRIEILHINPLSIDDSTEEPDEDSTEESDKDYKSRPAKRSFFEMPEFVFTVPDSDAPVVPVSSFGGPDVCDACNPCDLMEDCYTPPNCKRKGEITFKPGARIQSRYMYDDANNQNDFLIRRTRIKGSGKVYDLANYGLEIRFDNAEKFGPPTPITSSNVENAWVCFDVVKDNVYLKVGLYDLPFSRAVLTSDSKTLFQDRNITSGALTSIGMADNGVGLTLHGRPLGGKLEYGIGVYDNIRFDAVGKNSNGLMPLGRVAWYFLDPAVGGSTSGMPDGYADYRGSYLGQGNRLVLGAQFASLPNVRQGASEFDVSAWSVDLLYNSGPWVFEADYSWFAEEMEVGASDLKGEGWTVQGGYMLNCCWELAARYQALDDPITPINGSTGAKWTSIGMNYYFHEHNFKVQGDYTWKDESGVETDNDLFQVQLQLDF